MGSRGFQCNVPHRRIAHRQGGPFSVYSELAGYHDQGCHWSGKFKVREKSGNFRMSGKFGILLKVREIQEKSSKFKKIYIS